MPPRVKAKPESIHLIVGRRPNAAFGKSTGDRQILEYTNAGDGARKQGGVVTSMKDEWKKIFAFE